MAGEGSERATGGNGGSHAARDPAAGTIRGAAAGRPGRRGSPGRKGRDRGLGRRLGPRAGRAARAERPGPLRGRIILLIEDDPDSVAITRDLLRLYGVHVVTAPDGVEAFRVLERERPDVILCDLRMPRMDGFAFIAHLRQHPTLARRPVLALTAYGSDADYRQTWAAGFDGHLTKPVSVEKLIAALRRVLAARPDPPPPPA